jgi:hypothetical protein
MEARRRDALRKQQRDEAAGAWGGFGTTTHGQAKGAAVGTAVGALIGALIFLPLGLIPWAGVALGWRLLLAALVGALAGATAFAVYLGGREPEREGEVVGTEDVTGAWETEASRASERLEHSQSR